MTRVVADIEKRALASVDAVLVWNDEMLQSVRPYCRGQVGLAAPGVDTSRFIPHTEGWRRDGPILSICRLADRRKGLDRMIRAYALMVAADPTVPDLVLAGRGQLPERDAALIQALGLTSRVKIQVDIAPDDLPHLYRSASVFLQSSHEEGFGVSVLEAMASGVPVVTTETAGTKMTVLDGETGWLVPQHMKDSVPEALATRTLDVLAGAGVRMGRRAREHVESVFSSEVSLAKFTEVYDKVLAGQSTRKRT